MQRILGVDYGTRYLGFALGDVATRVAVPLEVVDVAHTDPVKCIWGMVESDGYDAIVLGTPRTADGDATEASARVERFAQQLEEVTGVPVHLVSEHLTSKISDQLAHEVGQEHSDALAAMLIVQEYLDALV